MQLPQRMGYSLNEWEFHHNTQLVWLTLAKLIMSAELF